MALPIICYCPRGAPIYSHRNTVRMKTYKLEYIRKQFNSVTWPAVWIKRWAFTSPGDVLVRSFHRGFRLRLLMKHLKGLHTQSRTQWQFMTFFFYSITLNYALAKKEPERNGGRIRMDRVCVCLRNWWKCYSRISRWRVTYKQYFSVSRSLGYKPLQLLFSLILFSLSFSSICHIFFPSPPPEKIRSVGGFCLFYTIFIMEDGASRSSRTHPVQAEAVRQDGHDKTRHVEAQPAQTFWLWAVHVNACFPYCLFIASWTSQSIGKTKVQGHKGRWVVTFLLLREIKSVSPMAPGRSLAWFTVQALIGDPLVPVMLYSGGTFWNNS